MIGGFGTFGWGRSHSLRGLLHDDGVLAIHRLGNHLPQALPHPIHHSAGGCERSVKLPKVWALTDQGYGEIGVAATGTHLGWKERLPVSRISPSDCSSTADMCGGGSVSVWCKTVKANKGVRIWAPKRTSCKKGQMQILLSITELTWGEEIIQFTWKSTFKFLYIRNLKIDKDYIKIHSQKQFIHSATPKHLFPS